MDKTHLVAFIAQVFIQEVDYNEDNHHEDDPQPTANDVGENEQCKVYRNLFGARW